MKIKKVLITIITILALGLIYSVKVEAFQELNELTFDVQINEDGSMNVIETWDIYIDETNTLFFMKQFWILVPLPANAPASCLLDTIILFIE